MVDPPKAGKPIEESQVTCAEFLGEQDGPSERLLKEKLFDLLVRKGVNRAYLARARFAPGGPIEIALCLRVNPGVQRELVGEIGEVFASIFSSQENLAIFFLDGEQETAIAAVCAAFFSSQA